MFPLGWNVSEPIQLAIKLYRVAEALGSAPDSAKAFVTKITNFSGNLTELQRILDSATVSHSTEDLERLRTLVVQCQACVGRCEKFREGFEKLTKDGKGKMDSAGQAARWTLHERKAARLREEINEQINDIGFALAVRNLADARTRQDSHSATSSCNPPIRSGPLTSLPPYSSPEPDWAQTESPPSAKTPAHLLGIGSSHKRGSDTLVPNSSIERLDCNDKGIMASPPVSPNSLCSLAELGELSELHLKDSMIPLERRRNTMDGFAVSPTGLGNSSALSEASGAASRVFTSPTISSRRTSTTDETNSSSRRDSIFALEHAVMETAMDNLSGVQASYYKDKSRISYPVSTIEAFRNKQNGRRYIIISPPSSSNIKLYLAPPTQRIVPHSEHPQAYGPTQKHKVKFIEQHLLRSQKISLERRPSDAPKALSPSLPPVSPAASVISSRSCSSPILTVNNGVLREESRRQEYDFEKQIDYHRFQELLMGPDVTLQLQVPIQSIAAKKYKESKLIQESHLQLLRLWYYAGHQTLMFFANLSSNRYREYRLENLRPVESKFTTTIRLEVHLPGMVRRRSSSQSPLPINVPATDHQDQARSGSGCMDENDMTDLDYLSIKFDDSKFRTAFLHEARFHRSAEEPAPSPLLLHSRSPPP